MTRWVDHMCVTCQLGSHGCHMSEDHMGVTCQLGSQGCHIRESHGCHMSVGVTWFHMSEDHMGVTCMSQHTNPTDNVANPPPPPHRWV